MALAGTSCVREGRPRRKRFNFPHAHCILCANSERRERTFGFPGRRRSGALRVRGGSIERPSPWCALAAGHCPRRDRQSFKDYHQLASEAKLRSHLHQNG